MLKRTEYNLNEHYKDEYNLVVGVHYGSYGIIPCHNGSQCGCVSSSGDSLCGAYSGHEMVEVDGTTLYIVKCNETVKCRN